MPYVYDARYNSVVHVDDASDDAVDENGLLRDGKSLRVRMPMMDHATVTDAAVALEDARQRSAQDRALYNLDVSNRWRGGIGAIQAGDMVKVGDQTRVVWSHDSGKLRLRDASAMDGEALKQDAYDAYEADLSTAWMNTTDAVTGEACLTAGREKGTWRRRAKDGRLVCVPTKSADAREWEVAGPLSDAERVEAKDRMYSDYDAEVSNAWRR